jgi:hypothetical protein
VRVVREEVVSDIAAPLWKLQALALQTKEILVEQAMLLQRMPQVVVVERVEQVKLGKPALRNPVTVALV